MVSNTVFKSLPIRYWRAIIISGSLALALLLLGWALTRYGVAPSLYGWRTATKLMILSLIITLAGRLLLEYVLRAELSRKGSLSRRIPALWRPIFLLDINAPIYLAIGAVTNIPAAVVTALLTQIPLQVFTAARGIISWTEACYRMSSTALLVLIAGKVYKWIVGPPRAANLPYTQTWEFIGSSLAALIMLILIVMMFSPLLIRQNYNNRQAPWRTYLFAPLFFQGLILSLAPLFPMVDMLTDGVAELAWVLFLSPLFAFYYLALVSTRMSMKTYELQQTLRELKSTRQRRDELSNYASLITRTQEDERRRLARELHDDTAQALIALSLGLDGMQNAMEKMGTAKKYEQWLTYLHQLTNDTLEGVRRACQDLRPSVLDNLGLRAALEWLSHSSAVRGTQAEFACLGNPRPISSEAEIVIFRIVQEALSNIWKHAHATKVSVELCYMPKLLCVVVRDNGKGFLLDSPDTDTPDTSSSPLGLIGMRERALLIGATLTVSTLPGNGCTVSLFLPL